VIRKRLKPLFDLGLYGAAETAPFQSVINIIKVGDY
jgi:hypothetical protein